MTRVIKLGGRVQQDPSLAALIASQWQNGEQPMVIVHGGGDAVTQLQKVFGVEARFEGGRRVTSAEDVDLVRMALSGLANKQLVSAFVANGINAVGISGEDDGLIGATPMTPASLGHVGEVTTVRPAVLHALLSARCLPVVSPVSRNVSSRLGPALNVNGDDAASVLAIAVDASELLLISDVPGVLVDRKLVASLSVEDARALIANAVAVKGMAAKLEAAITAIEGGVASVRIGNLSLLTDTAAGTTIVSSRAAAISPAPQVQLNPATTSRAAELVASAGEVS